MNQESPTNPETTLKGDNLLQPAQTPATPPPPQKQEASPMNENPNPTPRLTLFTNVGLMEKVDRSFLRSLLE